MTPQTLRFLLNLVNAQQIAVGAPDFLETVEAIRLAQEELNEALSQGPKPIPADLVT